MKTTTHRQPHTRALFAAIIALIIALPLVCELDAQTPVKKSDSLGKQQRLRPPPSSGALPNPASAYPDSQFIEYFYGTVTATFRVNATCTYTPRLSKMDAPAETQVKLDLTMRANLTQDHAVSSRNLTVEGSKTSTAAPKNPALNSKITKPGAAAKTTVKYSSKYEGQANTAELAMKLFWSQKLSRVALHLHLDELYCMSGMTSPFASLKTPRISIPAQTETRVSTDTSSTYARIELSGIFPDFSTEATAFGKAAKAALGTTAGLPSTTEKSKSPGIWLETNIPSVSAVGSGTIPMYYVEKNGVGEWLTEAMLKARKLDPAKKPTSESEIIWPATLEIFWSANRPMNTQIAESTLLILEPKNRAAYQTWRPEHDQTVQYVARLQSLDKNKRPSPARICFYVYDQGLAPTPSVTSASSSLGLISSQEIQLEGNSWYHAKTASPCLEATITLKTYINTAKGTIRAYTEDKALFATDPVTQLPYVNIPANR